MTIQQIGYFLHLSEELHYWRTSYKMNVTQSVLSRQIKALEDELQVTLFQRTNRKVELTAAGKFLQQQWKPLLGQLESAVRYARKIHKGEGGSIVLNHPGSISYDILPALLNQVSAIYPHIKVELVQHKHTQEIELIKNYQVDISFSRHPYDGDLVTSKLVRTDNLALVLPTDHPIRKVADISRKTLKNERFILTTLTDGEAFQMRISEFFAQYRFQPNISFESDFGSIILSLVARGLGISVIPYSYSLAGHPGVRFLQLPFEVPLYLHWRTNEDNKVVRNILDLITTAL